MSTTTVPVSDLPDAMWGMHPSKTSVVKAVGRRLIPHVIEVTLIPTALFYVFMLTFGLPWAVTAALAWVYAAVGRRLVRRRPIPGLLVVGTLGITLRSAFYMISASDLVYFLQPIVRTLAIAALFATSALIGRPLVARFAGDFCPMTADVRSRPAVVELFRRLTYLWAGLNITAAAVSLTLLLTVPITVFVGVGAVSVWLITATGVILTVSDSVRTARLDGLATAIAPGGRLRAYLADPE